MYYIHALSKSISFLLTILVGKSTTVSVVYLAQNEANHKDLLFNTMVQQTSWQAICMCIFVVKTRQCGLLINL